MIQRERPVLSSGASFKKVARVDRSDARKDDASMACAASMESNTVGLTRGSYKAQPVVDPPGGHNAVTDRRVPSNRVAIAGASVIERVPMAGERMERA